MVRARTTPTCPVHRGVLLPRPRHLGHAESGQAETAVHDQPGSFGQLVRAPRRELRQQRGRPRPAPPHNRHPPRPRRRRRSGRPSAALSRSTGQSPRSAPTTPSIRRRPSAVRYQAVTTCLRVASNVWRQPCTATWSSRSQRFHLLDAAPCSGRAGLLTVIFSARGRGLPPGGRRGSCGRLPSWSPGRFRPAGHDPELFDRRRENAGGVGVRAMRIECSFRVVDGVQSGLGRRWRHGAASITPGRVTFVGTFGGVRFLKRKPISVEVETVDGNGRGISGVEAVAVNPQARVVRVVTPTGVLEWALPADHVEAAVERVAPSAP